MTAAIPPAFYDLFEGQCLAYLGCTLADGSVLVHPIWCGLEGEDVVFVTARGNAKDKAARRGAAMTLCVTDPAFPYRYLQLRGSVRTWDEAEGEAYLDALARRYMNRPEYPYKEPGEVYVKLWFAPERVFTYP